MTLPFSADMVEKKTSAAWLVFHYIHIIFTEETRDSFVFFMSAHSPRSKIIIVFVINVKILAKPHEIIYFKHVYLFAN